MLCFQPDAILLVTEKLAFFSRTSYPLWDILHCVLYSLLKESGDNVYHLFNIHILHILPTQRMGMFYTILTMSGVRRTSLLYIVLFYVFEM